MERLIGNLWLVRGNLCDDFVPGGSPLVVLPAYINRAAFPIVDRMADKIPAIRPIIARHSSLGYLETGWRYKKVGDVAYMVVSHSFYSPYATMHRRPEYPLEREWHDIAHKATEERVDTIHWQEINDASIVDIPRMIFYLFFCQFKSRWDTMRFVYYNADWPLPPTTEVSL